MLDSVKKILRETSNVFLDKEDSIKLAVVCLLADGHLLIEDVPGVGKTTLVQTLGQLLGLKTHRIQFTIDLLPADILGGNIFNQKLNEFNFYPGPLFAQLVLADELNRASPRTQSALLQAMEENAVSIDGFNHHLPRPFLVIATQNPNHNIGTFPLPESQLDRFLMSLELNYASRETEKKIFQMRPTREKISKLHSILNAEQISQIQKTIEDINVSDVVADYVSALLDTSRRDSQSGESLSTRCGISLVKAAKALAYLENRQFVKTDDIKSLFLPVTGHRLGGKSGVKQGRAWAMQILESTSVPK